MDWVGSVADWKDAVAYAPLLDADRSVFAWEWLRREPGYREAADRASNGRAGTAEALAWGLHRFEDPGLASAEARPVWSANAYPSVLRATAQPAGDPADAFDLACVSKPAAPAITIALPCRS